jgi:hypothetical protein
MTTTNSPEAVLGGGLGGACPTCHRIHVAGEVVALGRFHPLDLPVYHIAGMDLPLFTSREDAQAYLCEQRVKAAAS